MCQFGAMCQFVNRYNTQWLVEKSGFPGPDQAREPGNAAAPVSPAA